MARSFNSIDRRALLTGRMVATERVPPWEIASILVQARPARLGQVEAAILKLPGCEVHGRDPRGKLIVVVDALGAGGLGATLNMITLLPDVYSASLVFHAVDAG